MTRRGQLFTLLVSAVVLGVLLGGSSQALAASIGGVARLTGEVLPIPLQATKLPDWAAATAGSDPITLTVTLNRTDERGFDAALQSIEDPHSSNYQQFLNQEAITDRFGPSQTAYDRVLGWLRSRGFSLVEGSANRLTLTVLGTRSQAEQAFNVSLVNYQLHGHAFYANDRDPVLPAAIAKDVQAVTGLSSASLPQSNHAFTGMPPEFDCLLPDGGSTASQMSLPFFDFPSFNGISTVATLVDGPAVGGCLAALELMRLVCLWASYNAPIVPDPLCGSLLTSGGGGAQTPPRAPAAAPASHPPTGAPHSFPDAAEPAGATTRSLRRAGPTGAGQQVGLVEYDSFHPSDVANWLQLTGLGGLFPPLPAQASQVTDVKVNGGAGAPGANEVEVLLDIDTVLTLAPGATVNVYEAPASTSYQTLFNRMITDHMTVISNSWSDCESQHTAADAQSIDSVLAQAVMAGIPVLNAAGDSGGTCLGFSAGTIGVPADSPHATAVGGSSIVVGTGATYLSEHWWNGSTDTPATGQGGFGASIFFSRPAYQNGSTTASMRSVPDVVANADPLTGVSLCQADAGGCPDNLLHGGTSLAAPEWAALAALLGQAIGHPLGNLNPLLYPLAGGSGFHNATRLGSDFAHVGLGSPNLDQILLALSSGTVGSVDTTVSTATAVDNYAVADGTSIAAVLVLLRDANGNAVSGKTVSLTPSGTSHALIAPASGPSSVDNGSLVFTITDSTIETVTLNASDTTDSKPLPTPVTIHFVSRRAAAGGIAANPTQVAPDGNAFSTITVTVQDGQGHGLSGKAITLAAGGGQSHITGPTPATTDTNGQVTFKVTDTATESVNYTATDVTDGNLPIPGTATVNFATGQSCNIGLGTAATGYVVSNFITGFPLDVPNSGCSGPVGMAFDLSGNLYVVSPINDVLYKFGPHGGVVSPANAIATLPQTNGGNGTCMGTNANGNTFGLSFGEDGRLYATQGGGFEGQCGRVIEIDPNTGAVLRTVAAYNGFGSTDCALGIATDPLSGDLVFSEPRCTFLGGEPYLNRIANPAGASPTLSRYSTIGGGVDGLGFAPDGTLYAAAGADGGSIYRVDGTNSPTAGTAHFVVDIPVADGIAVQPNPGSPTNPFLIVNRNDGKITKVDQSTPTPTLTDIYSGGSRGDFVTVGPDGCLYATQTDRIIQLTNADGSCSLAIVNSGPSLTLTPSVVSPNPVQGGTATFTAKLSNVSNPAGVSILFLTAKGAATAATATTAADGTASITIRGALADTDSLFAITHVGGQTLTSNLGTVTWTAGQRPTITSLNLSPTAGVASAPTTLTASLTDLSVFPFVPVGGAAILLNLGGVSCTATTDASGKGSCSVTPNLAAGPYPLTATFASTAQYLTSNDTATFTVIAAGSIPSLQTVTPASGAAEGGKPISIAGSNIQPGASVSIGGRLAGNIVVGAGGASVSATTPSYLYWGDVNGDTLATVLDALCLLRAIVGLPETPNCPASGFQVTLPLVVSNPGGGSAVMPGGYTYNTGDLTGNGPLSVLDALCLLRSIVGLSATQNCPAPAPPGSPSPGQSPGAPSRR